MAKFVLPPPEPIIELKRGAAKCDWCGDLTICTASALPISMGHFDYTTEMQLLKGSALFDRLKEVRVLVEKEWHERIEYAAICDPCVQSLAKLTKKGA